MYNYIKLNKKSFKLSVRGTKLKEDFNMKRTWRLWTFTLCTCVSTDILKAIHGVEC